MSKWRRRTEKDHGVTSLVRHVRTVTDSG